MAALSGTASAPPMPRLLLRYVTGQVAGATAVGLVAISVFVGTADLIGNLSGELRHGVPVAIALQIQALKLPEFVVQAAWVAMLGALLLVLGQMARRREYTAMLASGVSIYQISAPVLFVACVVSLVALSFQELFIPGARDRAATLRAAFSDDARADLRGVITDVTYLAAEHRSYVIKQLDVDRGEASDIRMDRVVENRIVESLTASAGAWLADRRRWEWSDVIVREFDAENRIIREEHLERLTGRLRASPAELRIEKRLMLDQYNLAYLSIAQLGRRIRALARSDHAPAPLYTVYYAKWSEPLSPIAIALLAVPGALGLERRGLVRGVVLTVAASVAFFALRQVGLALGRGGAVPPIVGAFGPLLLTVAFGAVWLRRTPT